MSKTRLYTLGGEVHAGSSIYIRRQADEELERLCRNGGYGHILTPRQMGKSSLIGSTARLLENEGIQTAVIDLTQMGTSLTADQWYMGLLTIIGDQLSLKTEPIQWWMEHAPLAPVQRLRRFFQKVALVQVDKPIVIFIDEIDTTLNLGFKDDFYAALYTIHDWRAHAKEMERLSFVLAGVALDTDLAPNIKNSPFAISEPIELTDFTMKEALPLAQGFGLPSDEGQNVLGWILKWTGGHPFLTQSLCQTVANRSEKDLAEPAVDRLVADSYFGERAGKDNNLQLVQAMLTRCIPDGEDILALYRRILMNKQSIADDPKSPVTGYLKLSGAVLCRDGRLQIRNEIYRKVFGQKWLRESRPDPAPRPARRRKAPLPQAPRAVPRIFISYKRNAVPDEEVVGQVYQELSQAYKVFIDKKIVVGTRWATRIESELYRSDYLIVFLSDSSISSEMVLGEIEKAHHFAKKNGGRPAILPIRIAYRHPFQYPVSAYLDPINWAFWDSPQDTSRLIAELHQAIKGGELSMDADDAKQALLESGGRPLDAIPAPLAQPALLETPEGTISSESCFYVERAEDSKALQSISHQGATIIIKGPRQMGKSSLLIRTINSVKSERRNAFLDFQLIDKTTLGNEDAFFRQFCWWLTDSLSLTDRVDEFWKLPLSNPLRCTRYVQQCVLQNLAQPLVLAMDEVERLFDAPFRTDFFGMLRSWHNLRQRDPLWKRLDLVLVTSTEPYQFIDDLSESPFNVGDVIELSDFDYQQVEHLNGLHGSPFPATALKSLMGLLNGHPYLTRRSLYMVSSQRIGRDELFEKATDDRGPFGDHLRYHLLRLSGKKDLIKGLQQAIVNHMIDDDMIFFRLRGAGLVRKDGRQTYPRCKLYADYFQERLHV